MTTAITQIIFVDLHDIQTITIEIMVLQLHLFSVLKVLRGEHQDMIARGIVGFEHPNVDL